MGWEETRVVGGKGSGVERSKQTHLHGTCYLIEVASQTSRKGMDSSIDGIWKTVSLYS